MNQMLRVVLVDDDIQYTSNMEAWLRSEGHEVAGVVNDGRGVLGVLLSVLPDVIILTMVLPGIDGLAVMEQMTHVTLERMPAVIAVCNPHMHELAQRALKMGAAGVLHKPITAEALKKALYQVGSGTRIESQHLSRPRISMMLMELGIPVHLQGYQYLQEAIRLAGMDQGSLKALTTKLYPDVAKATNTTPVLVERSIRHAIEVAWSRGAIEAQHKVFGNTIDEKRGKPTNGEFIARVVERLRLEGPNV